MTDWIDDYVTFKHAITDTPTEFIKLSALFLVSTACDRIFKVHTQPTQHYFRSDEKARDGGMLLNINGFMLGKSRISRKR